MTVIDLGQPRELPYLVLWVDPGLTNGWATLTDGETFRSGQAATFELGELVQRYGYPLARKMALGWERYTVTSGGRFGTASHPLEAIGMLRWQCYHLSLIRLADATPSQKRLGSVKLLKKVGWYLPGQEHANDAAQHLLAWLLRTGLTPPWLRDEIVKEPEEEVETDALRGTRR